MDRTIEVSDLPTGISKRSLEDKLMIHFLRAKNGGGEIIDVVFPTELLSSALIIFEEAEVAQRVLQTENQILKINGKQHKLKVKSANSEIKVDQVIPHISMTIDYGKLLDGKRLMKNLQKTHKAIQFGFDPKVEQCTVGGTFSAIKELSGKIHHLLTLSSDQSSANSNETKHQLQGSLESADFSGSNRESDPNPGEPFKGGEFKAYLPESHEGKKVLQLLQEAFNKGLIFKVVADPPRPAYVTWNAIPHKTAVTGGRQKNGYPDSLYMKKVLAALAEHGLQ
ncbi:uncharacterized protein LOC134340222 isoform X4 [Mobula hypostoma]|uniref:uncharacterized protein LOC134340222 isoform X4 n=1 Tax=Mobula hypostoma TaxID=723540 RepID=UPI002FC34431